MTPSIGGIERGVTPQLHRTEYGFAFGAADVSAMCSDAKRGWVIVGVNTPKLKVQVYVTKTGKTRISVNGMEVLCGR